MKIFIGQAVTGEDREKLKMECSEIIKVLKEMGHEPLLIIDYPEEVRCLPQRERLANHCFKNIDECDAFLVIMRNGKKSEGMLMEIGHILDTDKKIILAINKNIRNTYLREIADQTIEFEDFEDLKNKLKEIK